MSRAVHQLLPVFSYGDAIGGAVQRTRAMLQRLGFESDVFATLNDHRMECRPASELRRALRPGDAVMYHLSIGSPLARLVERLDVPTVIVYHNITPAGFFRRTSVAATQRLEQGRDDLRRLALLADLVIGVSTYNLRDAVSAGARRTAVVPPPIDLARLHPRPASPASPPLVLFVGRVAPNKRHDRLIAALAALRATAEPGARLVLPGQAEETSAYHQGLLGFADALGVADAVVLPGRSLSDDELGDLYASASVFTCASDHEGFCVPLLEAMSFSVPVVAYAAGAVPETLAGAGVLLRTDDPLVWAEVIARTIADSRLREHLAERGRQRLHEFSEERVEERLAVALAEVGICA